MLTNLVVSTVSYLPKIGGTELILHNTLKRLLGSTFKNITVFSGNITDEYTYEGIQIIPYSRAKMLIWAYKHKPDWYYANLFNSRQTIECLSYMSIFTPNILVNMVGGYEGNLHSRITILKYINKYARACVETDMNNFESYINQGVIEKSKIHYISQGLNTKELGQVAQSRGYYLYPHNLWSWKNPIVFIKEIVKKLPQCNFIISASDNNGDLIDKVLKLSKNIKNLKVILGKDRKSFIELIRHSEAVISTSRIEGTQPNILLESAFLKVPYLSLFPNQFYSQYHNAIQFETVRELREFIVINNLNMRSEVLSLESARKKVSGSKYSWEYIIREYNKIFFV